MYILLESAITEFKSDVFQGLRIESFTISENTCSIDYSLGGIENEIYIPKRMDRVIIGIDKLIITVGKKADSSKSILTNLRISLYTALKDRTGYKGTIIV